MARGARDIEIEVSSIVCAEVRHREVNDVMRHRKYQMIVTEKVSRKRNYALKINARHKIEINNVRA